jgi:hypothetical protein
MVVVADELLSEGTVSLWVMGCELDGEKIVVVWRGFEVSRGTCGRGEGSKK